MSKGDGTAPRSLQPVPRTGWAPPRPDHSVVSCYLVEHCDQLAGAEKVFPTAPISKNLNQSEPPWDKCTSMGFRADTDWPWTTGPCTARRRKSRSWTRAIARCLRYRDMNQAQLLTGTEAGAAIAVRRLWREAADQPPARLVPDASAWRSDLCKSPAVRERVATRAAGIALDGDESGPSCGNPEGHLLITLMLT